MDTPLSYAANDPTRPLYLVRVLKKNLNLEVDSDYDVFHNMDRQRFIVAWSVGAVGQYHVMYEDEIICEFGSRMVLEEMPYRSRGKHM